MSETEPERAEDGAPNRDLLWLLLAAFVAGMIILVAVFLGGGVEE